MVVKSVGLEMPTDFPEAAYNDILAKVGPLQPKYPEFYRHHAGAWNAVAMRFKAAADADVAFRNTLLEASTHGQRFRQETALFSVFANLMSVLDSVGYALHAVCHLVDPEKFELAGRALRDADFRRVAKTVAVSFPSEPLVPVLNKACSSPTGNELRDIRNVLTHRVASSRSIVMSTKGPSPPDRWKLDHLAAPSGLAEVELDERLTPRYRKFVADTLAALFPAVLRFIDTRL